MVYTFLQNDFEPSFTSHHFHIIKIHHYMVNLIVFHIQVISTVLLLFSSRQFGWKTKSRKLLDGLT